MNLEDYQKTIGDNAQRIAQINKDLESLDTTEAQDVPNVIDNRRFNLEMEKANLEQEQQEIVTHAYNNMRENIQGLRNLSEVVPRDTQDREEMAEEQQRREAEIANSRAILPEELQEQIRQEFLARENTPQEVIPTNTPVVPQGDNPRIEEVRQEVVPVTTTVEPLGDSIEARTTNPRIEENDPNIIDVEAIETSPEMEPTSAPSLEATATPQIEEHKAPTIADYQAQIGANATAIAAINQQIESLQANGENDTISSLEMRRQQLQQQNNNSQRIVDAYNNMRENIEELRRLSEAVPRDAQGREEIAEEQERREAEIINSRNIVPEDLQEQLRQEVANRQTPSIANNNQQEPVSANAPVAVETRGNMETGPANIGDNPRIEENNPNIIDGEYREIPLDDNTMTKPNFVMPTAPQNESNGNPTPAPEHNDFLEDFVKSLEDSHVVTPSPTQEVDTKRPDIFKYDDNGNIEFLPGTKIPRPRDRTPDELNDEDYVSFLKNFYDTLEKKNAFKRDNTNQNSQGQNNPSNVIPLPGPVANQQNKGKSNPNSNGNNNGNNTTSNNVPSVVKNNETGLVPVSPQQKGQEEPTRQNPIPKAIEKKPDPIGIEQKPDPLRIEQKPDPLGIEQKDDPKKPPIKKDDDKKEKQQPKRGLITIIDELTRGLEIKAKTGKKYTASNIKVAQQFKSELQSGNVWYNVVHVAPALLKSGVLGVKKFAAKYVPKMKLSNGQRINMMTLKDRIDKLPEEDIMTIYNEYRGSRVIQERFPSALNVLLQEKMNEFTMEKLSGLNQKIDLGYQKIFTDAAKLNAIDTELKQSGITPERKSQLERDKATCLAGKADLVQNIRNSYIEANQWMSGGLHGFNEDMKAAATKLSYVGKRFVKEQGLDNELTEQQAKLEQAENKAIAEKDDAKALNAFLQTEMLLSGETEIKNSIFGHRSTGEKYYMPKVEQVDYRDDPFVKDVFATVALVGAGVSAYNAIKTHGVEADRILSEEQAKADHVNATNQQTMDQVHQTGQNIADHRGVFQKGMETQGNKDVINTLNTGERSAYDQGALTGNGSHGNYNDVYRQADEIAHNTAKQMYQQTEQEINNIVNQYQANAITQAEAIAKYSQLANQNDSTLTSIVQEALPHFNQYMQSHPQFELTEVGKAMEYLVQNPDAIANMNQGMVDVTNMGESLTGLSMESVQALQSLPSDLQTTLFGAAAAAGLAYKVASTTETNAKKGKYGNELTQMVEEYSATQEEVKEATSSGPRKTA